MYRKLQITLALGACLGFIACDEAPLPVAALRASPVQLSLAFPHYTTLDIEIDMREALEPGARPWVMVHLLDLEGSVVRTFDHELPGDWAPGQSQKYGIPIYQSALSAPLPAGTYELSMGLYDGGGARWPLETAGEEAHRHEYAMATVEALLGSDSAPKSFFSPSWMATEAGTDVQVLGRRWLRDAGAIRFSGIEAPGLVRLHLRIAPPDPQLEDLILDEGFEEAQLDVSSTCSEETWTVRGVGTHVVEVPLAPAAEGEEAADCEVALTPHYKVVTRRNLNARVLALDLLAWQPQAAAP